MRVILLGHRGYVGSAFNSVLRESGIDVVGVDRSNYAAMRGTDADVLINAAGSSDRRLAERDPMTSFVRNVSMTLDSCLAFRSRLYVYISTVAVYNDVRDPVRNGEDEPVDPLRLTPYGQHKFMGEMMVRSHAARWVIARLGPLVGKGIRKNSIFDLLARKTLFVHPDSELPYAETTWVARTVWDLRSETNCIYNIAGRGRVRLGDLARDLGIALEPTHYLQQREDFNVNVDKLSARVKVPETRTTVAAFVREWASYASGLNERSRGAESE